MPDYTTTPQVVPTLIKGIETVPTGATSPISDSAAMFLGLGILGFAVIIILISIVATVLWIWSIIHIAKNENFSDENQKIIWLLLVIFTGIFGSIIYFFAKPTKKIK